MEKIFVQIRFIPWEFNSWAMQFRIHPQSLTKFQRFLFRLGLYNHWRTPKIKYKGVKYDWEDPNEHWSVLTITDPREAVHYKNMFTEKKQLDEYHKRDYDIYEQDCIQYDNFIKDHLRIL